MLFNSIEFLAFLALLYIIYWYWAKSLFAKNFVLLIFGYLFYAWWNWKFLIILLVLNISNYFFALMVGCSNNKIFKKIWLLAALLLNIGSLIIFKYLNFFIDEFLRLAWSLGWQVGQFNLKIISPIGISFYTFISLSYLIDVYFNRISYEKRLINVLLSLSFFPIILSGPIQRPQTFLPQITQNRNFDYDGASDALRQILWGLFMKIVIADSIGEKVDVIFNNYKIFSGSTLLMGSFLYSIQIYADFAGYSNIAIGIGKLFGFRLTKNFNYPYFSKNIVDFWKRWNISLTNWFRDYVFLPLSSKIFDMIRKCRLLNQKNTNMIVYISASIITWLLTGLWHGANYTFIMWGMINGIYLIAYHLQSKPRQKFLKRYNNDYYNKILVFTDRIILIIIVLFGWIFFRSSSIKDAFEYIFLLISNGLFKTPEIFPKEIIFIFLFLIVEYIQRDKEHALAINNSKIAPWLRWSIYYILFCLIFTYYRDAGQKFIYFQF